MKVPEEGTRGPQSMAMEISDFGWCRGWATIVGKRGDGCGQTASLCLRAVLSAWRWSGRLPFLRQESSWTRVDPLPQVERLWREAGSSHAGSWSGLLVRCRFVRRPARLPPAFERLDHDHASAAAAAWRTEVVRFAQGVVVGRRGDVQEFTGERKADLAGTAGKQAVMPDAVEAARQDMDQEAADELIGGERHDLLTIGAVAAVVLVAEGDAALVKGDQAAVRDRDPVGVAGQVGEHRLRAGGRPGAPWSRRSRAARRRAARPAA